MRGLVLSDQARADLKKLDRATGLQIAAAIQRLAVAGTGDIKKLQGIDPPEYRLRVGEWRVRFSYPNSNALRINRVQNRKDSYR